MAAQDHTSDAFSAALGSRRGILEPERVTVFAHLMPAAVRERPDAVAQTKRRAAQRAQRQMKAGDFAPVLDDLSAGLLGRPCPRNEQYGDDGKLLKKLCPLLTGPAIDNLSDAVNRMYLAVGVTMPVSERTRVQRDRDLRRRAHLELRRRRLAPALHDHPVDLDEARAHAVAAVWKAATGLACDAAFRASEYALPALIGHGPVHDLLAEHKKITVRQLLDGNVWAGAAAAFADAAGRGANPTKRDLDAGEQAARAVVEQHVAELAKSRRR